MTNQPKRSLDPASLARFQKAEEEFARTGACTVLCDRCGQPIKFEPWGPERAGQGCTHSCPCGKYNGHLKGL